MGGMAPAVAVEKDEMGRALGDQPATCFVLPIQELGTMTVV